MISRILQTLAILWLSVSWSVAGTVIVINSYRFSTAATSMTWTVTGLTASGSEEFEILVNDSSIETATPDGSGELTLTASVPASASVVIRCNNLDNVDSSLADASVSASDIAHTGLTTPAANDYPPFSWTYTSVTGGTAAQIDCTLFNARALANLVNNLDASTLTGLSNGDLVDTWTNNTGGTDATSSSTARGVYTTGWSNSLPALTFAGAQYYNQSLTGYTGGGYTVFFVCELTTASASHRGLLLGPSFTPYLTIFGSPTPKVYGYNGNLLTSTMAFDLARPAVVSMRVTPSGKAVYQGGTRLATNASGNTNLAVANISHPTYPWVGKIAQVIMVSDDLSDADMAKTTGMLEGKWAAARRFVICDGDSLTRGLGATAGNDYPSVLASELSTAFDVRNFGADSQTLTNMSSDAVAQIDTPTGTTLNRQNIIVAWGGGNDLYFGDSAATTISDFETYCGARNSAGLLVVACTIIDRTEGGGSWTAAEADTVNTSIRANWATYADALCDLAADARLSDHTDLTYYSADGTHLTDAGYAAVAELVAASVQALAVAYP